MPQFKSFILFVSILLSFELTQSQADCALEKTVLGSELETLQENWNIYIKEGSRYLPLNSQNLDLTKEYQAQLTPKLKSQTENSSNYLPYYDSDRLEDYLELVKDKLDGIGYKLEVVGKSVRNKPLYAIFPKNIEIQKPTIIMLGRQHGDEGTQNYIIEGFFNEIIRTENAEWISQYQVILYPMINPDGADARKRYNANGRDLNREWDNFSHSEKDEAKTIHAHLREIIQYESLNVINLLDMHGSFTEDFIYRVDRSFISRSFFSQQQNYIDLLASFDPWQAGNFQISNGHRRMARIIFNKKGINALTHETPREIKSNNSRGRNIQSLRDQGVAIFKTFPVTTILPFLYKN